MERAIIIAEDTYIKEIPAPGDEVSLIRATRTYRVLPNIHHPPDYEYPQNAVSRNPLGVFVAESREPKAGFTQMLLNTLHTVVSGNTFHVSRDPSAATREAWALFDEDLYDINREQTVLDLEIENQKLGEKEKATYMQDMDTSKANNVAQKLKQGECVLLVGGLREKEVLAQAAHVVNVDYVRTGREDLIGDIEKGLQLPPDSFDHVVMFNLFEILYNPRRACSEAYRLLKPGGVLWVGETYGPRSQGLGLLMHFRNTPAVYEQLRLRGLLYYPDSYEAFSISPPFIRHAMYLGGFFRTPIELEKGIMMVIK